MCTHVAVLSWIPVIAAVLAAMATFAEVKASCMLEASAFRDSAAVRSLDFTKGATAVMTSAMVARGATVVARRLWLTA